MDLLCPSCSRHLTIPQTAPGVMLQCPFCHNVFQIAPAPAHAQVGAPAGGQHSAMSSSELPSAATSELPEGPVVRDRPRIARRKKSNALGLVCAFVLLMVAVGGVAYFGASLLKKPSTAPSPQQPLTPEGVASQQARQFLIKEAFIPADSRFPPQDKVQAMPGGRWVVTSHVDVPARLGGVLVRQDWSADLTQAEDGSWVLDHLKLDRDTIVARKSDDSKSTSEEMDWEHGIGMGGNRGPDRSTRWAVGRLAVEIQQSAELGPTLVVWLIDRSMSARPQQQAFMQNVDKALPQGVQAGGDKKLQMAVVSFGSDVKFVLEEPTSDAQAIRQALEGVEEDQSGQEKTFQAIGMAAEKYRDFRSEHNGYVILAVVSDEVGDDDAKLDETLNLVRQQGMAVSVIGVTAPFGRVVAPGQQADESAAQGGNTTRSLVQQGPESRYLEMIDLAFAGGEVGAMESGFGPFALTRLCQETGGTYYACRDFGVASTPQYSNWTGSDSQASLDPQALRRYAPDYVSEEQYRQILASNKACRAIHEAAKLPHAQVLASVNTMFTKRDEASFKRSLDAAQRDAAKFEPDILALYEALKQGESDRAKLTRPRWQAAYDLAMGRVLAARVRTEGYNAMLAKLKSGGNFENPDSTTWVLEEAETIGAGSTFEKMLAQSRMYLTRVVKDHPGTPWAILAERELRIKSGWELTER